MLYDLSHTPNPFCFSYFSGKIAEFSLIALEGKPPAYASCLTAMTDMTCTTMPSFFVEMGFQ
jgi:hypothetical protein